VKFFKNNTPRQHEHFYVT